MSKQDLNHSKAPLILLADDDEDDRMFTMEAFDECKIKVVFKCVQDGVELLDYLKRQNQYTNPETAPRPALILLDLNMPKMDGREALMHIKLDPTLKTIPVVALTTSKAEQDVLKTYSLGVNSFITKPVAFKEFVTVADTLGHYWLEIVQLP